MDQYQQDLASDDLRDRSLEPLWDSCLSISQEAPETS